MSLRRLAWGLFALYVVLGVATMWSGYRGPEGSAEAAFGVVLVAGYAFVGTLIASLRPRGAIGWLLLAISIAFALDVLGEAYAYYPAASPGYVAVAVVTGGLNTVWITLTAVFLPLVFPTGRLPSRRWRPLPRLAAVGLTARVVGGTFRPGALAVYTGRKGGVQNPIAASGAWADVFGALHTLGTVLVLLSVPLVAASLVQRFRRARGPQRQQLKWFAYACALAMSSLLLGVPSVVNNAGWSDALSTAGYVVLMASLLFGIPLAIGVAILRHRLYDIDVVINRTLVYGLLTAVLAGTYVALVLLMRLVLDPVTGQSDLAVAASTLAVAALVRPLRSRIQSVVDRRFYRARYDAARTLESFTGRLRDELDLDALAVDLRGVVRDTVQPEHVSLWIRSDA